MSELPQAQKHRLEAWADRAILHGWLPDNAKSDLQQATNANPGQLFEDSSRPLVAGLFGGTGVGKSSLLNRLAGEPVARASAERPTSRDITVYVHRSVSVERLPENLPLQRMRTSLHNNDMYRRVMFIDMPDFDSVEQSNRELVDLWLPHLDVVMYVVSPERYRDDQGWQLLRRHAKAHAWLFIINQWDRGSALQRDDFIEQLASQGLADPLVFCTDCANPDHAPGQNPTLATDDFQSLQQTLLSLSDDQIIHQLQEHGILARLQELRKIGDQWLRPLGDDHVFADLSDKWAIWWEQQYPLVSEVLQWPCVHIAQSQADDTPFIKRLLGRKSPTVRTDKGSLETLSQSLNERVQAMLDSFLNQQAHEKALPLSAIRASVAEPYQRISEHSRQTLEDALNHSLLNPGNQWQRRAYSLMNALCLILPLSALGWISFRVITSFAQGSSDPGAYLNSSFAVNGALLLGVSWLLPALAHTRLKPSREAAALKGLELGIQRIMEQTRQQVEESLQQLAQQVRLLREDYLQLWTELPSQSSYTLPESVQRMLSEQVTQSTLRELDVRANTHNSTESAPLS